MLHMMFNSRLQNIGKEYKQRQLFSWKKLNKNIKLHMNIQWRKTDGIFANICKNNIDFSCNPYKYIPALLQYFNFKLKSI